MAKAKAKASDAHPGGVRVRKAARPDGATGEGVSVTNLDSGTPVNIEFVPTSRYG